MLRTQSVSDKTDTSTINEDVNEAGSEANTATDQDVKLMGSEGDDSKSSIQVAATVGLTISKHQVNTSLQGSISAAGGVSVLAGNEGNFRTLGTGTAMSLAANSNAIAAGVAVSVNRNEANIEVGEGAEIVSEDGDVEIAANLTQNTTGKYNGLLGA